MCWILCVLVQENDAHLINLNASEDMEGQEPLPEDEEEEEELIVLDPEHVCSFSFNTFTTDTDDSQKQEARVELFRVQKQLARLQNKLEDHHQTKAHAETEHQQAQDQYYVNVDSCNLLSVSQLQTELDDVMQHLIFTQGVSEDLHSKVKTMNNVRHKAGAEKTQAEDQKMKQDMYVERLTKDMEGLTQQIAMYEAQANAQAEETLAVKEALSELLLMARKQLLQQWNSSLTGMRRRDEAFNAMQDAIPGVRAANDLMLLDREIEGYKKSTAAEQDQNETLTMQLNWSQKDCDRSKKLISQKQAQQDALLAHYSTCLRTLHQTERTLTTLTKEASAHQAELNDQRRQLEKESSVRLDLENKIVTSMQQKLTHNTAAEYSQRLTSKMASLKKEKERRHLCHCICYLENKRLTVRMESQQVDQHVNSLATTQQALDEELAKYNKLLTLNQNKISSFYVLIDQKQVTISNLQAKIWQIAASTGHDDLSPLQIKIQAVVGEIEDLAANIRNDQQVWMRQQGTLVGLTQEIESNSRELLKLQIEYTEMQQKNICLESMQHTQKELEKNVETLKRDLVKLSTLLSKKGQLSQALEQENALTETDFVLRLKEAERGCIEVQMKLEEIQEEKERLLYSLVEAERQVMLWEKKTQLLKETRSGVDSGQGEIQTMKAEIHRMEVRLGQLRKQQEQLLKESEATVARRETIVQRREAMIHSSHKRITKGDLSLLIQGLQRKIQECVQCAADCERAIKELQQSQVSLADRLTQQKQHGIPFYFFIFPSFQKLAHLVALQSRTKKLQAACEGTYQALSSSESLGAALQSQTERVHAVSTILHRVCEEFPQHQEALRQLVLTLAAHTQAPEQDTS
uniref:Coiled-coil domain containing 40 n=1 Tax=Stegastes partitus TaxID=144197 RepID=A0A3B5AB49_9TELE